MKGRQRNCAKGFYRMTPFLPGQSLKDVFCATAIGRMMYFVPAWHGFCLASDYMQLNSFLCHAVTLGYYKHSAAITDLFHDADHAFFEVYSIYM